MAPNPEANNPLSPGCLPLLSFVRPVCLQLISSSFFLQGLWRVCPAAAHLLAQPLLCVCVVTMALCMRQVLRKHLLASWNGSVNQVSGMMWLKLHGYLGGWEQIIREKGLEAADVPGSYGERKRSCSKTEERKSERQMTVDPKSFQCDPNPWNYPHKLPADSDESS